MQARRRSEVDWTSDACQMQIKYRAEANSEYIARSTDAHQAQIRTGRFESGAGQVERAPDAEQAQIPGETGVAPTRIA